MPRTRLNRAAPLLLILLVFTVVYLFLGRLEPRARWLQVEAPAAAFVGEQLEIRITLGASTEPVILGCNLNWAKKNRERGGMLASGSPYPTVQDAGTHVVRIPVRENGEMGFVSAIIYLTPTGNWRDSFRAAYTELIPVKPRTTGSGRPPLKRLRVYPSTAPGGAASVDRDAGEDVNQAAMPVARPSAGRKILALFLIAGGMTCAFNAVRRRPPDESRPPPRDRKGWMGMSIVLTLAAATEVLGTQILLTGWARRIAEGWGIYYFRRSFQKPVAAGLAAAAVFLLFLFLKKGKVGRTLQLTAMGVAGYLLASVASMLSYHAVDAFPGLSLLPVSLPSLLKAFCATLALTGALAGVFRTKATSGD